MASVIDIRAVSYDVCGVVRTVSSGYKAKVIFISFILQFSNHIFWRLDVYNY